MPSNQVLRWTAEAVGGVSVVSAESMGRGDHRASGTFRLGIDGSAGQIKDVILKVPVPRWIGHGMVTRNARALKLAEAYGLAAPRLIAADLEGRASGTVASLETFVSGTADLPPTASVAWLREAGAAIARVHAFSLEPQPDFPFRPRPCAVDDRAAERRRGMMPTTPLLQQADEQVRSHGMPAVDAVLLHGDVWEGNMLWEGDRCVALIDWKTAGVGDPGVDLGNLRLRMALQYGEDAPAHVLEGWEREAGRAATAVPYWDAVAALNTPTVLDPPEPPVATERRDAFARAALDQL
jgi:aminoglycoside phosphotransferase (APT) family kinase protein